MLRETVDSWIQDGFKQGYSQGFTEGITKGISEGILQGIHAGMTLIIERQINIKFGKLSPAQKEKLNSLTAKQLLEVTDKILSASSIEDILGEMTVAML